MHAAQRVRKLQKRVAARLPALKATIAPAEEDGELCRQMGVKKHRPFRDGNGNLPDQDLVNRMCTRDLQALDMRQLRTFYKQVDVKTGCPAVHPPTAVATHTACQIVSPQNNRRAAGG